LREIVASGRAPIFADEIKDNHGVVQVPNGATLTTSEILYMRWLEYSVGDRIYDLSEPRSVLPIVPLIIRTEFVA
jgi:hypothetical protein